MKATGTRLVLTDAQALGLIRDAMDYRGTRLDGDLLDYIEATLEAHDGAPVVDGVAAQARDLVAAAEVGRLVGPGGERLGPEALAVLRVIAAGEAGGVAAAGVDGEAMGPAALGTLRDAASTEGRARPALGRGLGALLPEAQAFEIRRGPLPPPKEGLRALIDLGVGELEIAEVFGDLVWSVSLGCTVRTYRGTPAAHIMLPPAGEPLAAEGLRLGGQPSDADEFARLRERERAADEYGDALMDLARGLPGVSSPRRAIEALRAQASKGGDALLVVLSREPLEDDEIAALEETYEQIRGQAGAIVAGRASELLEAREEIAALRAQFAALRSEYAAAATMRRALERARRWISAAAQAEALGGSSEAASDFWLADACEAEPIEDFEAAAKACDLALAPGAGARLARALEPLIAWIGAHPDDYPKRVGSFALALTFNGGEGPSVSLLELWEIRAALEGRGRLCPACFEEIQNNWNGEGSCPGHAPGCSESGNPPGAWLGRGPAKG